MITLIIGDLQISTKQQSNSSNLPWEVQKGQYSKYFGKFKKGESEKC